MALEQIVPDNGWQAGLRCPPMSATFADRLLRVRYVALVTAAFVLAMLIPPIAAVWPPTLTFPNEIGTLVTEDGEITVDWMPSAEDQTEISVRRWRADGTVLELGRAASYPSDVDDTHVFSANDFVMVCETPNGPVRYLFGAVATRQRSLPAEAVTLNSYKGPAAMGARFEHGLYIVILAAGALSADARITIYRSNGVSSRTAGVFDDAVRFGRRQASGCFIA